MSVNRSSRYAVQSEFWVFREKNLKLWSIYCGRMSVKTESTWAVIQIVLWNIVNNFYSEQMCKLLLNNVLMSDKNKLKVVQKYLEVKFMLKEAVAGSPRTRRNNYNTGVFLWICQIF